MHQQICEEYGIDELLENNKKWSEKISQQYPDFFSITAADNKPDYMWVGCCDSRVSANQVLNLYPGKIFVHRNVGNVVVNSDLNLLSAVQFAVERLKVKHILVVGHYDCSGVKTALEDVRIGLADNWLRHILSVRDTHYDFLKQVPKQEKANALTEVHTIEQLIKLAKSTVVQDAWNKQQNLQLHGLVYNVKNGKLKNLNCTIEKNSQIRPNYLEAIDIAKNYYLNSMVNEV